MIEFEIKSVGHLKYSRLKSLSILRKELYNFNYAYTINEVKELLDSILNNTLSERFNLHFKNCFDLIFDDMVYIEHNNDPIELHFPNKWIAPIG
jgi:hypothetical protein